MNIQATSPCPIQSAMALDDFRVNKMILESAQIICTTLHKWGLTNIPYKPTHQNHPVVLWADRAPQNLSWLIRHHCALAKVFRETRGKDHLSFPLVGKRYLNFIVNVDPGEFANCAARLDMRIDFRHLKDPHEAYRLYMIERWKRDKRPPTWIGRGKPSWA